MMSERHKYKPVAVRDTFEELTEDDLNVLSIGGRLRRRRIDAEGAAEVKLTRTNRKEILTTRRKKSSSRTGAFSGSLDS